jgi:hypothetical protein
MKKDNQDDNHTKSENWTKNILVWYIFQPAKAEGFDDDVAAAAWVSIVNV